jgi:titin
VPWGVDSETPFVPVNNVGVGLWSGANQNEAQQSLGAWELGECINRSHCSHTITQPLSQRVPIERGKNWITSIIDPSGGHAEVNDSAEDNAAGYYLGASFIETISGIMRARASNYSLAADLLDHWFDAGQRIKSSSIGSFDWGMPTVVAGYTDWFLDRANAGDSPDRFIREFNLLRRPDFFDTRNSRVEVKKLISTAFAREPRARVVPLTMPWSEGVPPRTYHQQHIQHRMGQGSFGNISAISAAFGGFSFYLVPIGTATKNGRYFQVSIDAVAVHVSDSFDFNGSQQLGCWSPPTRISLVFIPGYECVYNSTFRSYRNLKARGGDFNVFMRPKIVPLNTPLTYRLRRPVRAHAELYLSRPEELTVTGRTTSSIDLSWVDTSVFESSFEIEGSRAGAPYQLLATIGSDATSVQIPSLPSGTSYRFRVRACDSQGCSEYSDVVSTQTVSEVPAAPTQLRHTNVWATQADVAWTDNSNNETEFRIAISRDGVSYNSAGTTVPNDTSYRLTQLLPGTCYTVKVRAAGDAGYSDYSNILPLCTDPVLPNAPTNLRTANIWATQTDIVWDDNSDNESEFRVALSSDNVNFDYVGSTAPNDTGFRLTQLSPARCYYTRVRAANAAGYSDYTNTRQFCTSDTAPARPSNPRIVNLWPVALDFAWNDESSNETEFRVAISTDNVNFANAAVTGSDITVARIANLNPNVCYFLKVRAVNAIGESDYTDAVQVCTPSGIPQAPSNPRVVNLWATALDFAWNDNSGNETEFRVAISTDNINFDAAAVTESNATVARISNLTPNRCYYLKVRAANSYGYSSYSDSVLACTPEVVPAAPTNLRTANVWSTAIDLVWDDNSNNETEFRIAQSTDNVNFNLIGTTVPNDHSFRATGLTRNRVYYFRVRAANAVGYSGYTNTLQVRTLP